MGISYTPLIEEVVLMERVNIHLTPGEVQSLKHFSNLTGVSRAEVIRRAIDEYIRRRVFEGFTGLETGIGAHA